MAGTVEKTNNAAGGTPGQPVTLATTGGASGTPFDRLILPNDVGAGNTFTFDTTVTPPAAPVGTQWYLLDQAVATSPQLLGFWWTKPTPRSIYTLEWEMRIERGPAAPVTLFSGFSDPGWLASTVLWAVNLNTVGNGLTMFVRNSNALDTAQIGNGANSGNLALNTNYTCQILVNYATLTMTLNVYPLGGTTLVTSATKTMGVAATVQAIRGGLSTANANGRIRITNIREGFNDFLSRIDVSNAAPVLTLSAAARRTFLAGSVVDFPASATDNVSIASLTPSWVVRPIGASTPAFTDKAGAVLTGIGTPTASRTSQATLPSPGTWVMQFVASDGTVTDTDQYTIEVYPADNVNTLLRQAIKGSFQVIGSTNDNAGALVVLQDGLTTTLLDSGVTPTNMKGSVQLGPLGPTGIVITGFANVVNGGTLSRKWDVYKEDHTTLIYTITQGGVTGATTMTLALDAAALAAVPLNSPTDIGRAALWVDWTDTIA